MLPCKPLKSFQISHCTDILFFKIANVHLCVPVWQSKVILWWPSSGVPHHVNETVSLIGLMLTDLIICQALLPHGWDYKCLLCMSFLFFLFFLSRGLRDHTQGATSLFFFFVITIFNMVCPGWQYTHSDTLNKQPEGFNIYKAFNVFIFLSNNKITDKILLHQGKRKYSKAQRFFFIIIISFYFMPEGKEEQSSCREHSWTWGSERDAVTI